MANNKAPDLHIPVMRTMRIGHDKRDVIWQIGTDKTQRLPWEAAIYFSKAIMAQARNIEELIKADKIVSDQSFLLSQGINLGLSTNRDIIEEAHKASRYEKYRKVGSDGIASQEVVGVPKLIQHPPKKEDNNGKEKL